MLRQIESALSLYFIILLIFVVLKVYLIITMVNHVDSN